MDICGMPNDWYMNDIISRDLMDTCGMPNDWYMMQYGLLP